MKRYLNFINKARNRFNSSDEYVEFQRFQAEWILDELVNKIDFSDRMVLDLGSGSGGYTIELAKRFKIVYALDLNIPRQLKADENIFLIKGDATNLPFKNNSIDFIFCSSLIEHIQNQQKAISEAHRVLKNNSFCYLSFPPFYSPVGGHQFKPFHLLGENTAIILSKLFKGIEVRDFETSFGNWGLFPTTVDYIKKLVKKSNFIIVNIHTRFSPINFAKIPFLGEFLTWHVEFFLHKRGD